MSYLFFNELSEFSVGSNIQEVYSSFLSGYGSAYIYGNATSVHKCIKQLS